jgi:hypothetical protein
MSTGRNGTVNKKLCWSTAVLPLLSPLAAVGDEPTGPTVWDGFSGFLSPDWDRDFSATVGVKIWVNDWTRGRAFISSGVVAAVPNTSAFSFDTAPDSAESNIEAVPVPQLSVRYKWFFVAGSYYAKTGFDFDDSVATTRATVDTDGDGFFDTENTNTALFSTSGDRYEWDASGGVYIHPYVALLGGYKKVRQEVDLSITETTRLRTATATSPPSTVSQTLFSDIDIEGPTIGIAASSGGGSVSTRAIRIGSWMRRSGMSISLPVWIFGPRLATPRTMLRNWDSLIRMVRRAWPRTYPSRQQRSMLAIDISTSVPSSTNRSRMRRTLPRALRLV